MIRRLGESGWLAAIVAVATLGGPDARAQAPVPESQLETFLGLSTGSGLATGALDGVGNGPVMNGSAIMQSITVTAGDTLSFSYNFLTNAPSPASAGLLSAVDPFAFITQPALTDFADNYNNYPTGLNAAPAGSGFLYQTGLSTYSATFTTAGTYNFGIGVVNVTTDQYRSGLEVTNFALTSGTFTNGSFSSGSFAGWTTIGDNSILTTSSGNMALISTAAVPEPSSILLMIAGGLGAANILRRRARRGAARPPIA